MQLTLVFLVCFVSVTWQQNVWLSEPIRRHPFYFGGSLPRQRPNFLVPRSHFNYEPTDIGEVYYYFGRPSHDEFVHDRRSLARTGLDVRQQPDEVDPKILLNPNNYVNILSVVVLGTTSTVYSTTSKSVSLTSSAVCYTSTMFTSTTPCLRKRSVDDLLLLDRDDSSSADIETDDSALFDPLPRGGSEVNLAQVILPSLEEPVSNIGVPVLTASQAVANQFIRQGRVRAATVTTTITNYSVSVLTVVTTTNTILGSANALTCLPSGYLLC